MYVVFGANGRVGNETARNLIERGEPVRVVLRSVEQGVRWKEIGAEVAVASVDDVDAVSAALKGAAAAFLFNPPPAGDDLFVRAEKVGATLAESVRRTALPKAVILSSLGAQHSSGTGAIATINRFEALLDGAAQATLFLRPGFFFEDLGDAVTTAASSGVLSTFFVPSQRVPMISVVDIGRAAAQLLCEDWQGTRVVDLDGPDKWSMVDLAGVLATLLGRPITPEYVSGGRRAAVLAASGYSAGLAAAVGEMYDWVATDPFTRETGREVRRGTESLAAALKRMVS